jgi:arylsulfatase A-like enzyme
MGGKGLLVWGGILFCSARMASAAAPDRPNILFILSDDHAAHALSCYGSVINRTPQLDRIATNGMLFTHCFVNNSICTPSRAAILTGKYSHLNGVTVFNRFDGRQPHLAKYLQQAGYQTAIIGKWHLFSDPTGFDYWNVLPGQGRYLDPILIEMGKSNVYKGYVSDIIVDLSLDWLKKRDPTRPFCLMSQPKAPHRQWTPPAKYTNLYDGIEIPEPATFNDDYRGRSRALPEATMRMEHLRKTDLKAPVPSKLSPAAQKSWRYQRYIKDYLRCVTSMDDNVGRLLDYLESTGLATNTIVVYSSDQGFFLGDHGWFDKRFMYEESLRMPLLVSWPGHIRPGTTNEAMVLNVDFAPTLLEAAGLTPPPDMQGRSFLPLLRGEQPTDWRHSMYYRYYHYPGDHQVQPHYGVRTERHKLIYYNKLDEWELYDLEKDPHELNNIYRDPTQSSVVRDLKAELARLRQELDDRDQFVNELSNEDKFHPVPLELVLRPDFSQINAQTVADLASRKRTGQVVHGQAAPGRQHGVALRLEGDGRVEFGHELDPSQKPFTVGAWCKPDAADGVILAHGGRSHGYTLFLKDGVPHFAVRDRRKLAVVKGKEALPIGQWTHLAGMLTSKAQIRLWVNGAAVGTADSEPIAQKPRDALAIGDDPESPVGEYGASRTWKGLIEDARIYWGELDNDALEEWAGK